jgi:transcriptional regulator with XRE-family HTH domain
MPAFTFYTRADRDRALALRAEGKSRRLVSKLTGVTQPTLQKWEQEAAGLRPPSKTADELGFYFGKDQEPAPPREPDAPDPGHRVDSHGQDREEFLEALEERLEERFLRLSREPRFGFYQDMLGDPPPHRSALWQKLMGAG